MRNSSISDARRFHPEPSERVGSVELMNDKGKAPRSLGKVIPEGLDGVVQNLRGMVGDAEVMNDEGEGPQSPAKVITEGRRAS